MESILNRGRVIDAKTRSRSPSSICKYCPNRHLTTPSIISLQFVKIEPPFRSFKFDNIVTSVGRMNPRLQSFSACIRSRATATGAITFKYIDIIPQSSFSNVCKWVTFSFAFNVSMYKFNLFCSEYTFLTESYFEFHLVSHGIVNVQPSISLHNVFASELRRGNTHNVCSLFIVDTKHCFDFPLNSFSKSVPAKLLMCDMQRRCAGNDGFCTSYWPANSFCVRECCALSAGSSNSVKSLDALKSGSESLLEFSKSSFECSPA